MIAGGKSRKSRSSLRVRWSDSLLCITAGFEGVEIDSSQNGANEVFETRKEFCVSDQLQPFAAIVDLSLPFPSLKEQRPAIWPRSRTCATAQVRPLDLARRYALAGDWLYASTAFVECLDGGEAIR